ncbi:TadE family type IV pilus minor pilin [Actinokineospora sp. HUAS TT18]|uniref:TadE family type IV pilus minor pilin n=1 Tax=Actinokineospora sp. HUAS TT18 TaxID=3447451 RepID=UPI003F51C08A
MTESADRGAVTVETALVMPLLVAFLVFAVGVVAGAADYIRCVDAAREAARLTARGEPARAHAIASDLAPHGADIRITQDGDAVSVRIRADPVAGLVPGIHLSAEAFAIAEPDEALP